MAERLRQGVQAATPVTISIGVATCRPEEDGAESLIGRADAALYQTKQSGRNRVVAQS